MEFEDEYFTEDEPESRSWTDTLLYPFKTMVRKIHFVELFFIRLYNIYAIISQMFFFIATALLFNEFPEEEKQQDFVLIGLKTLLFYSVFTYFATKTRDILQTNRPSFFRNWSLTEGLCRIVIEWAKAIIVVICLREQGIHFKPSLPYAAITFTYYLCTEKIFTEIFLKIFQFFAFQIFSDLEHLLIPLSINLYTVTMSISTHLLLMFSSNYTIFLLFCFYFTIYIRLKDSYYNYWRIFRVAKQTFEQFRYATQKELEDYDDICAVCLTKMSRAKITPCNHYFHPDCLKRCLQTCLLCPICKFNF